MKITQEMVNDFNDILESLKCSFKLEIRDIKDKNPSCQIVPSNDLFIDSAIINVNNKFYNILESFFSDRDIDLSYNNTKDIFWSTFGWN